MFDDSRAWPAKLDQVAEELGVVIGFSSKLPEGWLGAYYHKSGCILLRPGMDRPTMRSVFAHELGHAYYGHERAHDQPAWRQEALADQYAAKLLIDPRDYDAFSGLGLASVALARTLMVLPWVVDAFGALLGQAA